MQKKWKGSGKRSEWRRKEKKSKIKEILAKTQTGQEIKGKKELKRGKE